MADRMKKLLAAALEKAEQAEIYRVVKRSNPINFYNFRQVDVLNRELDELSLRVISNGRIGTFAGSATTEPSGIVAGALLAAANGPEATFDFPNENPDGGGGRIYDPRLESLEAADMVADAEDIYAYVKERHAGMALNLYLDNERSTVSVINSAGREAEYKSSIYTVCLLSMYERSKEGLNSEMNACRYFKFPAGRIDELIIDNRNSERELQVPTKKMPVIFRASSTWALLYRLLEGVNGNNVALGLSPLVEKKGERIFGDNLTMIDDPTLDWARGSTPFDDEGVPTRKKVIVENGVLRNFIFDLGSAARAGVESTGNGTRRSMWMRGVEIQPNPRFNNLVVAPGDKPFDVMVSEMDEGLIVNDVIGFHSGNILQGHYSMNVGIGFYVKDGAVAGRAMDTMIAGNIYDDFFRVTGIGDKVDYNPQAYSPDILIDGVSVSGRK